MSTIFFKHVDFWNTNWLEDKIAVEQVQTVEGSVDSLKVNIISLGPKNQQGKQK